MELPVIWDVMMLMWLQCDKIAQILTVFKINLVKSTNKSCCPIQPILCSEAWKCWWCGNDVSALPNCAQPPLLVTKQPQLTVSSPHWSDYHSNDWPPIEGGWTLWHYHIFVRDRNNGQTMQRLFPGTENIKILHWLLTRLAQFFWENRGIWWE